VTDKSQAWLRHLAIGRAALAMEIADLEAFAAVSAAFGRADFAGAEDAWVRFGGLSPEKLAPIVSGLGIGNAPGFDAKDPSAPTRMFPHEAEGGHVISHPHGPVRYQQVGVLGTGGMGKVVECRDTQLDRRVAVKTVRPDYPGKRAEAALMLEREARLTGGLEHPNIIPVYDAGEHPTLGPQYVMRLVEQPTLERVLGELRHGKENTHSEYRLGRLLRYLVQVCQAIEYAHSRGVIHCDLKPANILLGAFGEVIIVDWGLAFSETEGVVYRGGTPGYMAPEQLDRARKSFDARTDVFALGCILYEVLTLKPPFHVTLEAILSKRSPFSPAMRPSERAPHRAITADLEEIAMAAIELDPLKRTGSARQMAEALEAVIEGTKERERRRQRADELAAEGDDLAGSHFQYWLDARPKQLAELDAVRETVAAWEPPAAKTKLWEVEDRLAVDDSLGARILQASVSAYEQALAQIPDHKGARKGLARLYNGELQRARTERRDQFTQRYLEELVRLYDDGTITSLSETASAINLDCTPRAEVQLIRYEDRDRRLVACAPRPLGKTPVIGLRVEPGFYAVLLRAPGLPEVLYPVFATVGQALLLKIDVTAAARLQPGEIFVPGGPALLGGGQAGAHAQALRELMVPSFVIMERPVTVDEYLEFIEACYLESAEQAAQHLPGRADGVPYWERRGPGDFVSHGTGDWGTPSDLRALPVFGIDAVSAEAYCSWRAKITGLPYRLPNEHEWEKAARGTDGRVYPWGDFFDASFCKMRDSRPFAPRPEPPGSFPADSSPYGVRDMAGGVAEWVVPTGGLFDPSGVRVMVTRGGAWCDWQVDCVLSSRRPAWASERAARVGFRMVRDP
jgi:formylglycine-generating enzyme required for sulfatase activity